MVTCSETLLANYLPLETRESPPESGLFISARLVWRSRCQDFCAMKRGQVKIPSDFADVVWTSMNDEGWKQALSPEVQDAGYEIDWNKVIRS